MLRRMMLETIKSDPEYDNGNYVKQPHLMKIASVFYGIATAGGTLNYQHLAPTREKADELVNARLAAPMAADANDWIWQWQSSDDYDAMPDIAKIEAAVLAINSADDERNPPETGLVTSALKQVKSGKLYLIPARSRPLGISPRRTRGSTRTSSRSCCARLRSGGSRGE
jgi:homoserine O-acetyltransferase